MPEKKTDLMVCHRLGSAVKYSMPDWIIELWKAAISGRDSRAYAAGFPRGATYFCALQSGPGFHGRDSSQSGTGACHGTEKVRWPTMPCFFPAMIIWKPLLHSRNGWITGTGCQLLFVVARWQIRSREIAVWMYAAAPGRKEPASWQISWLAPDSVEVQGLDRI